MADGVAIAGQNPGSLHRFRLRQGRRSSSSSHRQSQRSGTWSEVTIPALAQVTGLLFRGRSSVRPTRPSGALPPAAESKLSTPPTSRERPLRLLGRQAGVGGFLAGLVILAPLPRPGQRGPYCRPGSCSPEALACRVPRHRQRHTGPVH
jgi:hypothetical protein